MTEHLTDTLTANQAIVESFRNNPTYNYDRQLGTTDTSLIDDFMNAIDEFLSRLFRSSMPEPDSEWWPIIVGAIVIMAVYALLRYGVPVFKRISRKSNHDYDIESDDINSIDFDSEIAQALASGNLRNACRLVYLKTLKVLSDNGAIDWKLFKTPLQYTAEVRDPGFNTLTNHFLKVRYGDFKATRTLYDEMLELHLDLCNSLADEPGDDKEGGDA